MCFILPNPTSEIKTFDYGNGKTNKIEVSYKEKVIGRSKGINLRNMFRIFLYIIKKKKKKKCRVRKLWKHYRNAKCAV